MVTAFEMNESQAELRDSLRHDANLSFSIPLVCEPHGQEAGEQHVLVSHTRDIGDGGLALFVPSLPFAYRYLISSDYTIRFTLDLPSAPVEIEAVPIYDRPVSEDDMDMGFIVSGPIEIKAIPSQYERYEKDGRELGCLLGVRIKRMSESDRALYQEYLNELEFARSIKILPPDESDESPNIESSNIEGNGSSNTGTVVDARQRFRSAA